MIAFLAGNLWWVLGLAVMAFAIVSLPALLRFRWQVAVAVFAIAAGVQWLHARDLQQEIAEQRAKAAEQALAYTESVRGIERAHVQTLPTSPPPRPRNKPMPTVKSTLCALVCALATCSCASVSPAPKAPPVPQLPPLPPSLEVKKEPDLVQRMQTFLFESPPKVTPPSANATSASP